MKFLSLVRFVTVTRTCLTLFVILSKSFVCFYSVHFCAAFFLIFNRFNAILTDKLARAEEEGLSVKQMLDKTLMEIVNI